MADTLKALTIKYFQVWNSHDQAGIEALHAESSVLKDWNAEHGPTRADVAKGIAGIWADVPAVKIEVIDLFTTVTSTCVALIKVIVNETTTLTVTDVIQYDAAGLVARLDAYQSDAQPHALKEATAKYFQVWNSHDPAGIESLHAEKSVLKDWNAEHGPTRVEVAKGIAGIWKDVPAVKIEIVEVFTSVTKTCVALIKVVVDEKTTLKVADVLEYDDSGLIVRLDAYQACPKPKVLFVLGGPGAGKGTQCAKIIEEFTDWAHVSAGDCLRAERQDPNSKDGELIEKIIKEGKIVPVAITVKLIMKAMVASGKKCILVDGFPRNLDNVTGWTENVGELGAQVCGVLYYEAKEDELEKRLLGRSETSGRSDDNIESIRKRFKTYISETMPIIDAYKAKSQVFTIDGMPPVEDVWKVTEGVIRQVEAMPWA